MNKEEYEKRKKEDGDALIQDMHDVHKSLKQNKDEQEYEKHLSKSAKEWDSALSELADDRKRRRESKSMIQPGQKLKEGDCVYNLSREQVQKLLDISGDDRFVQPSFDGLVFSGNELYPIQLEYCSELEEYNFADFKKLCENTFKQQEL